MKKWGKLTVLLNIESLPDEQRDLINEINCMLADYPNIDENAMNRRIALVIHQEIDFYLKHLRWSFESPEGNDTCDIIRDFSRHKKDESIFFLIDQAAQFVYQNQLILSIYQRLLKQLPDLQTYVDNKLNKLKNQNHRSLCDTANRKKNVDEISKVFISVQKSFSIFSPKSLKPFRIIDEDERLHISSKDKKACVTEFLSKI